MTLQPGNTVKTKKPIITGDKKTYPQKFSLHHASLSSFSSLIFCFNFSILSPQLKNNTANNTGREKFS